MVVVLQLAHGIQHSLETSQIHQSSMQMMDVPGTEDSGKSVIYKQSIQSELQILATGSELSQFHSKASPFGDRSPFFFVVLCVAFQQWPLLQYGFQ
jgi:hypothetical protein